MKSFIIALQFLTILPVKIKGKIREEDLGRSLVYFPVIGLFIGLILAVTSYILTTLPPLVRSALILTVWIITTGGLHLDGFADTCDGFYGKRPKEDILKIMRDSRIGTMGALGIVLVLLFKFAALSSIRPEALWKVLIIAAVFARWSQAFACVFSKYARDEGKAKYFIEYAKRRDIFIGGLLTLILSYTLMGMQALVVFALSSAAIFLFIEYVKRKIGGMTGDTIGAANEIAEAAVLFFSLILLN